MDTLRRNRHIAVSATAATAASSWVVVTRGIGVHLGVHLPHAAPSVVGLGPVVGASVGATLLGWALLDRLQRRGGRALRSWTLLAVGVAVASLALPAVFATTAAAALGLCAIHLAVASVAITGVRRGRAPRTHAGALVGDQHLLATP